MANSIASALEGKEIAADYVRTSVPQSRWKDTWKLFTSCFGKLVMINVLTLLFCIPAIVLILVRFNLISQMGVLYPFSSNIIGIYPVTPDMQGAAERITLETDLVFFAILIAAGFIASVGLSGASYAVRKLINTHGEFTFRGYFRGIKECYFKTLLPVTAVLVFVFGSVSVADWAAYTIAMGGSAAGPVTAEVFIILATVVVGIIAMWVLGIGASYKLNFKTWMSVSLSLCFKTIVQTIFIIIFAFLPAYVLLLGIVSPFFMIAAYIIYLLFGFSLTLLCWFAYTQWVLDLFVEPVLQKEKEVKHANASPKQLEAGNADDEKTLARELLAMGRSELIGRPLRPIAGASSISEVGKAYGRAEIAAAAKARSVIEGEVREYYEQHKGDARYVEYEKLFSEREKALQAPKDKKSRSKMLKPHIQIKK